MDSGFIKRRVGVVDIILSIIFLILLIAVIVLFVVMFNKSKTTVEKYDITLPLVKKGEDMNFSIDLSLLDPNESMEYYFKITNTLNNKTNKNSIKYKLTFNLTQDLDLELYRNSGSENILNSETLETQEFVLKANELQEDKYKLVIKAKGTINSTDMVTVNIES